MMCRFFSGRGSGGDSQQITRRFSGLREGGGREIETEGREVAVVGAEKLPVQPDVGGEEGAADAQHDPARVIRPGELGPVPDRLPALGRGELARNLDRFPSGADSSRQPFGLALAQRHPHGFPPDQLATPGWALRQRHEQGIAHAVFTNAPSAVAQTSTGLATAVVKAAIFGRTTRARMLPPKPAPMMRAPRHPSMDHARSTIASTPGVDTSKSSRRLMWDSRRRAPIRAKSRSPSRRACAAGGVPPPPRAAAGCMAYPQAIDAHLNR